MGRARVRRAVRGGALIGLGSVSILREGTSAPARTGPLEGPNFPSEDRDLPYWAGFQVKFAIGGRNCAKLGKSQGPQPKISPFGGRVRAGQTFPLYAPDLNAR